LFLTQNQNTNTLSLGILIKIQNTKRDEIF